METPYDPASAAIRGLELELVVRGFTTVLNEGGVQDLIPFLDEEMRYRASHRAAAQGRAAVLAMISDIRDTFPVRHVKLLALAVDESTVLAEQELSLGLAGCCAQTLVGFASFRFRGTRILEWTQVYA
jgi:hypothetical protein